MIHLHNLVIGQTSLLLVFDNMTAEFTTTSVAICGLTREASNVVVDGSSLVGSMIKKNVFDL